jgi:hypothetical protein
MASDLAAAGWSSSGDRGEGVTHPVRDEAAALPARRRLCRLSAKSAAYRRLPDNDLRGALRSSHSCTLHKQTSGQDRSAPHHLPNLQGLRS